MKGSEDPLKDGEVVDDYTSAMTDHPLADTDPLISPAPILKNPNPNPDPPLNLISSEGVLPYLNITVSNPKKEVESYVSYLICSKTNIPEFGGGQFSVRRRFKEVVTLSERLAEAYRGFIIPPRPDKSVVEAQLMHKQDFVEQRRNALEKYLQRLSHHPVIRQSDEFRLFLQQNLPFLPTKNLLGDQDAAAGRWDFLRIMNHSVSKSNDSLYEQDGQFLQNKERLLTLEKQLTDSSKQAHVFVKAQQDIAETMGALGLSFIKLTKFENQHAFAHTPPAAAAADMKNLATAAIKTSRLHRELSSRTAMHMDTLHDHMGLLQGVHTAFSDRSTALLTLQTLTSELNSLYSRAQKLETFGSHKPNVLKLGEVKEAIRVTEDAKSCATNEYQRIKGNNRTEIERLDRQRKIDLKDMLKGFVLNQVAFAEKIGMEWAKAAEETSGYA
ncbi:putative sorting nexin Vps5-like, AH/BAR domain superfamily, PX domain superfamily [Helianthus annuus]|nr:putative sorting nexin Vps5-like, AH/BAR domain superfamily, PX domain superfamily [Helianthus annuus]